MRLSTSEIDMVHRYERRWTFLTYVKHWVAGGMVIGIAMTAAFLILEVPQQQDTNVSEQDMVELPGKELEVMEPLALE